MSRGYATVRRPDLEEAMGEGGGDDDEEGESEDTYKDGEGTRLAGNALEKQNGENSAVSTSELV